MDRPRIGITTSLNDGEQRLDLRYILAVEQSGGNPVIIPMYDDVALTDSLGQTLDGLIVTGGPAITYGLIGRLPSEIHKTASKRLETDKRILSYFLKNNLPVLGICYGMQLVNALYGGHIYADVETQMDGAATHSEKRNGTVHPVHITPGSHLFRVLNTEQIEVNTRHLQAIATLGKGLIASGKAPDGVIEAIETEDGTFIGVQFHPERMDSNGGLLFQDLVQKAIPTQKGHLTA